MPIEHISDTARWVAVYRAMETERPDALFRDPFARRLAGVKGEEIVDALHRGRQAAWAMIVRTAVFDEIILERISDGVDLVVNLAAGLDTRPWRLALPTTLKWVDVDLPDILEYKTSLLRDEPSGPTCHYEARATDLTDAAARAALFERLGDEGKRALVVTEGLLIYLTADQVASLARGLHDTPAFRWWVFDLVNPTLLKWVERSWGKTLRARNTPFQFAPAEGTSFFRPFGWRESEFRAMGEEARRLRREMPMAWMWRLMMRFANEAKREEGRRMSGVVLLERA